MYFFNEELNRYNILKEEIEKKKLINRFETVQKLKRLKVKYWIFLV